MNITAIIEKWNLNKELLASKVDISLTDFENKLNPDHPAKFNKAEQGLLQSTLIELRSDLEDVREIDWNTAMKIIAKKKQEKTN